MRDKPIMCATGLRSLAMVVVLQGIIACGGGGSSSAPNPPVTTPTPPAPAELTLDQLNQASKFASRASFGLTYEEIEAMARQGEQAWLAEQFDLPVSYHSGTVQELLARRADGEFDAFEDNIDYLVQFRRFAWWTCTVFCEDTLRQRVAFALSQILVVSDNVDILIVSPLSLSTYYDTLLKHAFGNYRDLLYDVALHPAMGVYLSHVNNSKSNPALNTFPDENFAREVMQLFSIGLFELNIDGSVKLDSNGDPIPTYDNDDIREFAKIFTGLSYGGDNAAFGSSNYFFVEPMQMFDEFHEPGEKFLLNGQVVPAGQTGLEDIDAAIDNLFNHPNTGIFVSKLLIQRLVTSNPTPAYIERVARVFNGDQSGVRGDMAAVIEAILTDPAATIERVPEDNFGKLREPVVRYASILRQFGVSNDDQFFAESGYFLQFVALQHPLSSPSVFNFYLPNYEPPGEIANANLVAPEFQITNSNSIINFTNFIDFIIFNESLFEAPPPFSSSSISFADYVAIADDVDALIDRLDIVLTHGNLQALSRDVIRSIISELPEPDSRVKVALYMILTSSDYTVEF